MTVKGARGKKRVCTDDKAEYPTTMARKQRKTSQVANPNDFAYCCVLYGDKAEYVLLLLVFVLQLRRLEDRCHPFLVLATADVPSNYLAFLAEAGCTILPRIDYIHAHAALFAQPDGRHRNVFTKLRVLGLTSYKKILLLDADLLPRKPLSQLFDLTPPAANLMPSYLHASAKTGFNRPVPRSWFVPDWAGRAARINCGVCLLEPDEDLLAYIEREISPQRDLVTDGYIVQDVFGGPWCPTYTPEEDAISRAYTARGTAWRNLGCKWNYEVHEDCNAYTDSGHITRLAWDRLKTAPLDVAIFHFSGRCKKPSYDARWLVNGYHVEAIIRYLRNTRLEDADPRGMMTSAWRNWLHAFLYAWNEFPDSVQRLAL